jgi:hypothetical protein
VLRQESLLASIEALAALAPQWVHKGGYVIPSPSGVIFSQIFEGFLVNLAK